MCVIKISPINRTFQADHWYKITPPRGGGALPLAIQPQPYRRICVSSDSHPQSRHNNRNTPTQTTYTCILTDLCVHMCPMLISLNTRKVPSVSGPTSVGCRLVGARPNPKVQRYEPPSGPSTSLLCLVEARPNPKVQRYEPPSAGRGESGLREVSLQTPVMSLHCAAVTVPTALL